MTDRMAGGRHERRACSCTPGGTCPAAALNLLPNSKVSQLADELWAADAARSARPAVPAPSGDVAARLAALGEPARRGRDLSALPGLLLRLTSLVMVGLLAVVLTAGAGGPFRTVVVVATVLMTGHWLQLLPPWDPARRQRAAERRTARLLRPVERAGYLVLRDLAMPGAPDRLGHMIVGATGIWAVESDHWGWLRSLDVRRRRRRALAARGKDGSVQYDQFFYPAWLRMATSRTRSAAQAVARAADPVQLRIRPLLCVHGSSAETGFVLDGVRVVPARQLTATLSMGPLLTGDELVDLATQVLNVVRRNG
jgi:hypothetical protein